MRNFKFTNPFRRKQLAPLDNKKSMTTAYSFGSFFTGRNGDNRYLTIKKALFYYDIVAPVATAVDIVNDEFKTLTLALETDGVRTLDAPILKYLQQPNDDMVLVDFLENLGNYYLVTNEVYLIATGRPDRKPAELFVESPEHVTIETDSKGQIDKIEVRRSSLDGSKSYVKEIFFRAKNEYRFYNKDKTAEIWQIKGFNTRKTLRGRSKLSSAVYEIEQYLQASIHNLGLLENGVRSTGAFISDEPLTDEQFDRLKQQIIQSQAGSENAGKSIILEGGMDYKEMSISPKDMDFSGLKRSTMEAIFRRYKIPLALVSTDQMAESTMEQSSLILYDNAVLPMAKRLLAEVTRFLAPRFNLSDDENIVPYMENITALQIRRIKEVKNKKEIGGFTTDEIRKDLGAKPYPDGKGETLYIQSNLVPIGTEPAQVNLNPVGVDNRPPRGDDDMQSDTPTDNERIKTTRENFISILKAQVDVKGNPSFTMDEIDKFADDEGL